MHTFPFGGPAPRLVVSFLLALGLAARPAQAFLGGRDCSSIASDFSKTAHRLKRKHIAVVPFRDTSGKESRSGAIIAERLVAALLHRGSVEVVERSQLEAVMEELRLASVGVVDPAMVKRLGRFLGVDAVVTGTTVELLGSRVEVHARLIDVETARVLAASTANVEKDWSDFETSAIWAVSAPPVPFFPGDVAHVEWHDSLNARPAAPACETDDVEVIDARARYWAIRLRDPGFSPHSITRNPGSDIADPRLKERFYSRLRMWYAEDRIPPLTELERTLVARCR
ncbi:MAG: hypothetical protein HY553_11000 [Elusimicrobia bacterium]|nr:hypothetical protein [Elusimicrobiota bacterium]